MFRRGNTVLFILSFAAVPWAVEACGRGANVLEGDEVVVPLATGGSARIASGGIDGGGGRPGSGGNGGSGGIRWASGGAGGIGTGGVYGPGGSPAGGSPSSSGGNGGVAGAGGGPLLPDGGDPRAAARWALSTDLCALQQIHPCLTYSFALGREVSTADRYTCLETTNQAQLSRFGDRCWTEWSAHVACALQRSDYCPCSDAGSLACVFDPWKEDFGDACILTRVALDQCRLNSPRSGTESGPSGSFDWQLAGDHKCVVAGLASTGDVITTDCTLSGDLYTHYCRCLINGVPLSYTAGTEHVTESPFCSEVAAKFAAGECVDALGCCIEHSRFAVSSCDCVVPETGTEESCYAVAEAWSGKVVDHCARYRPL